MHSSLNFVEDYPQDEPVAETKSTDKSDAAAAEPEPEAEAEPESDDHDHKKHGHSHDHSKKGHVHGSQGRKNLEEEDNNISASTKFDAVAWMIMSMTTFGILLQQNNFLTL